MSIDKAIPNYEMKIYRIKADNGRWWVAEYPSVTGVIGTSKDNGDINDIQNAINDLLINFAFHIESMKEMKLPIPKEDGIKL